jgi:hypothetical protein
MGAAASKLAGNSGKEGAFVTDLFNPNRSSQAVWAATCGYFAYVVLGGLSHKIHEHVYTRDKNKPMLSEIRKGKFATFGKEVYNTFFFPAFLAYHNTYRIHVLSAGLWMVTGVYNLRNQPKLVIDRVAKTAGYAVVGPFGPYGHRISGMVYVIAGFLKGITASILAIKSHSLGYSRWLSFESIRPHNMTFSAPQDTYDHLRHVRCLHRPDGVQIYSRAQHRKAQGVDDTKLCSWRRIDMGASC